MLMISSMEYRILGILARVAEAVSLYPVSHHVHVRVQPATRTNTVGRPDVGPSPATLSKISWIGIVRPSGFGNFRKRTIRFHDGNGMQDIAQSPAN